MTDFESECKVSSERPESAGGQTTGATAYPVRVEHLPTGTVAIVGRHRSQHKNRSAAMAMIEWELS